MPPDPADYQERYTSEDVCRAADITLSTLKNWMMRDPPAILMDREKGDSVRGGKGSPLLFSFNRVMQVAITAELVRMGLPPRRAAEISFRFSDIGTGVSGYVGDPAFDDETKRIRMPGQLYSKDYTVLVGYSDRQAGVTINVSEKTPLVEVFHSHLSGRRAEVCAVIWIDFVYRRVRAALQEA